jgi:hypothetical protein
MTTRWVSWISDQQVSNFKWFQIDLGHDWCQPLPSASSGPRLALGSLHDPKIIQAPRCPKLQTGKALGTASHLKIPCAFGQLQAADLKFFMQAENIVAGIPTNISRYQTLSYPIIVRYHKLCAIAACSYSYSLFV